MIRNKKLAYAIFVVVFTAIWYLFDFLFDTFITKSGFKFEFGFNFVTTVILGAALGYMFILREKKNNREEEDA